MHKNACDMWCGENPLPSYQCQTSSPVLTSPTSLNSHKCFLFSLYSLHISSVRFFDRVGSLPQKRNENCCQRCQKSTGVRETMAHPVQFLQLAELQTFPSQKSVVPFVWEITAASANWLWQLWHASLKTAWPTWSPLLPKRQARKKRGEGEKQFNCCRNLDSLGADLLEKCEGNNKAKQTDPNPWPNGILCGCPDPSSLWFSRECGRIIFVITWVCAHVFAYIT